MNMGVVVLVLRPGPCRPAPVRSLEGVDRHTGAVGVLLRPCRARIDVGQEALEKGRNSPSKPVWPYIVSIRSRIRGIVRIEGHCASSAGGEAAGAGGIGPMTAGGGRQQRWAGAPPPHSGL
jgi:hypothetical protein